MAETLVTILTAHLLGDFVLQSSWMVQRKRNIGVLILHVAIVTIVSWILLGALHWPILITILLTHLVMDAVKAYSMPDTLLPFLTDQLVHFFVLLTLAYNFPDATLRGAWVQGLGSEPSKWYFATLCFLSGLILVVRAGGMLIEKATAPFMKEIGDNDLGGLEQGGRYIGWLERSLVMLLLFIHQPSGIGFLIAAKSILRFGDIKNDNQRKVAEYIIIGTFLSFGWALLFSTLTLHSVRHWLPPNTPANVVPGGGVDPTSTQPGATTGRPRTSSHEAAC